jgi:predicted ATP-binding protein involved in virulence
MLCNIYNCSELKLKTDRKRYKVNVLMPDREPFGLHEMSDGYAALLNIYMELIMRMENSAGNIDFLTPAIVLIDELEAHLHVELQKNALPFLAKMFPNTQFIITTHSPFVINSVENAVVFDLENKTILEYPNKYSYQAIIESFLNTTMYAREMEVKFDRYKELNGKNRTIEEAKEFLRIKSELELIPPASTELYIAFNSMKGEGKAANHG